MFFNASAALAVPIVIDGGPDWPGSADVSGYVGNGVGPEFGTNTYIYPNAGNSTVANLYFGLSSTFGPQGFSANGGGVTGGEIYSWYADTANSIEYRGVTSAPSASGGNFNLNTRLIITADAGASVVSDATTLALGNNVHSLLHINSTSFTVSRAVEILNGSSWVAALPYYNSLQTAFGAPGTQSDFSTGFYWENSVSAVPIPAAVWLFGSGLIGLIGIARRTPRVFPRKV